MDNKMTVEQAIGNNREAFGMLGFLISSIRCGDEYATEHEAAATVIRQALSAPRVPDGVRSTIEEAASHLKNWLEMELCDCEGSHHCGYYDVKRTRDALLSMLTASHEPVATEPKEQTCKHCGSLTMHVGDVCYACSHLSAPAQRTIEHDSGTLTVEADGGVSKIEPKRHGETEGGKITGMSVGRISNEHHYACREIVAERDALRAEVEALKADAERYRWVKRHAHPTGAFSEWCMPYVKYVDDNLDAAIDAARLRERGA